APANFPRELEWESGMPRANNAGSVSHNGVFVSDPDAYQMYQSGQHVYSTYTMEGQQDTKQYPYMMNGEPVPQEGNEEEDAFIKNFKPGPNGFQEIPLELAQNYFDVTEIEDQACSSTGRTKFRMMINGQEMIIDGTVTPVSEYMHHQQQQPVAIELEEGAEAPMGYSVMHLPDSIVNGSQSMQMITLPDGQVALQVTQMEQKPQMAQVVTVDEDGNIISTDGTFAIDLASQNGQGQGAMMMTMQTDEFGNMYLQEESSAGPSTSSGLQNFHCMEVTGDPAEIAAMYPGMQMLAVNPDGTLESVFDGGMPTADTTYVNAKQYHRIMKRREARAKLEASGRVPKIRSKYLHESRHRHACNRVRGEGGKFNSKKGQHDTDNEQTPPKIKSEMETPDKNKKSPSGVFVEEQKEESPQQQQLRPKIKLSTKIAPALKARIPTPLTLKSPPPSTHQPRPTAVITHMPLPPQSKARPPGFRAARPSEIKKLLPTTYSKPGSTIAKVETLPDKILEESPSNSNSPQSSSDMKHPDNSDFSHMNL
ncbi:hypothetical protein PMAYCL1PPCAC_31822, partial [Pristionchus mayeri]